MKEDNKDKWCSSYWLHTLYHTGPYLHCYKCKDKRKCKIFKKM